MRKYLEVTEVFYIFALSSRCSCMSYVTWRLRAYIHKALLDALVLTVEELRKLI